MSDQCKHCECRGDYNHCNKTPCCHHENWINRKRIAILKKQQIEIDDLRIVIATRGLKEKEVV